MKCSLCGGEINLNDREIHGYVMAGEQYCSRDCVDAIHAADLLLLSDKKNEPLTTPSAAFTRVDLLNAVMKLGFPAVKDVEIRNTHNKYKFILAVVISKGFSPVVWRRRIENLVETYRPTGVHFTVKVELGE